MKMRLIFTNFKYRGITISKYYTFHITDKLFCLFSHICQYFYLPLEQPAGYPANPMQSTPQPELGQEEQHSVHAHSLRQLQF